MRLLLVALLLALPSPAFAFSEILDQIRGSTLRTTLSVSTSPVETDGIPRGATRAILLPLRLQASCEADVRIWRMQLRLTGPGDAADIERVYLLKGYRRLHRPVKMSSDDRTVMIRTRNLVIPACGRERVDVAVDFSREAAVGGKFFLELTSADDLYATASSIVGNFPIRTMPAGSAVTPQPVGRITVEFLPVAAIRAERDEILAKFRLEANTDAHQILHAITLTNKGTARNDDLRNMYITRRNGRALTSLVKQMDGDAVAFRFSKPYLIKRGQQTLFQMRGTPGAAQKTVQFTLEEPTDIYADSSRRGTRMETKSLR